MNHKQLTSNIKPLGIIIFLVVVIFIGIWASRQKQDIRKEASENGVNLLIVPQTNAGELLTTNSQFTREVVIQNPSAVQMANYELTLSFPSPLIEVVSIDTSMSPLPTDVLSTFDNTTGTIRLSRVDIGQNPTTQTTFTVARVVFRAKISSGTANVNFTQSLVSGTPTGSTVIIQLPVDSIQNGTYILSAGTTPTNVPPISTTPIPSTTPVRQVTVLAPNGDESLRIGQTYTIRWNSTHNFDSMDLAYVSSGNFVKRFAIGIPDTGSYNWTVSTDYPTETSYKIKVDGFYNSSNTMSISDYSDDYFTILPASTTPTTAPRTPTPSPTAVITTIPTSVFLNTTAFSLQGRNYTGASDDLAATISIKGSDNKWNTTIVNGTISNLALTNTIPGTHTLIVKPVGFLSREITQNLSAGQNTISLNNIVFCAGDIDDSAAVNSLDYSELLRDYGKNEVRSDLDGSSQVNSLDFSLLLSNFFETPATQECEL